ncbi:LytTR family DNA-binding domain-containing protein [Rhizobacter sp. SG703]|uniref:LytR/AlgR family response regulator transcription factor n=1 Tax=Rhizobacter sp. SG703 TaxID=2587140 RepID=UPI001447C6D3|nr:LytTR family DNA-binding domain-containing protein [Rhizobacter sp. SG703]NKI94129.1 two-component system LytT family response regulator [Rhizobacter sp. SG703]
MTTTRVLIAEDEPLAADALADWVAQMPQLALVATCADGVSALAQIRALRPQLVLMDIHMPGLNGLQVLKALADDGPRPAVIFTTAYDEHALAAFELHAVDYLLKPFARERLVEAIEHALASGVAQAQEVQEATAQAVSALEQAPTEPLTRVLVRDQGKIFPLHVDQIEYLRSDTKYTALVSRGRSFLVRLPIASFEPRLDPARFIRLHRGCIVNLDFVDAMAPDENSQLVVQMRDGSRITANRDVSRRLREQSL